jgi:hypothetical protein
MGRLEPRRRIHSRMGKAQERTGGLRAATVPPLIFVHGQITVSQVPPSTVRFCGKNPRKNPSSMGQQGGFSRECTLDRRNLQKGP